MRIITVRSVLHVRVRVTVRAGIKSQVLMPMLHVRVRVRD